MSPQQRRTRPEGLINRIGTALAHLSEVVEDLPNIARVARDHSGAASTQLRGAIRLTKGAVEALEEAKISLLQNTRPIEEELEVRSNRLCR